MPASSPSRTPADSEFSFYGGPGQQTEWLYKSGSKSNARLKGAEVIAGFKFDLSAHKGKTVAEAELHLARSNADQVFAMVAATINMDWVEGTACWRFRDASKDWTFPYSDFSTATFGNYGSLVSFGYATGDTFKTYSTTSPAGNWIAMKLDPAVVQALILDQPGGLAVTDPRGHLYTNPGVVTREAGTNTQPRLYIRFAATNDTTPPRRGRQPGSRGRPGKRPGDPELYRPDRPAGRQGIRVYHPLWNYGHLLHRKGRRAMAHPPPGRPRCQP